MLHPLGGDCSDGCRDGAALVIDGEIVSAVEEEGEAGSQREVREARGVAGSGQDTREPTKVAASVPPSLPVGEKPEQVLRFRSTPLETATSPNLQLL